MEFSQLMEIATSGKAEYRTIDPSKVDTHFSLDLHTFDAIDPERIAEDLEVRKKHIRSQIFRSISNEVIPNMAWGHSSGEAPDQWSIRSNSSGTSTMSSPNMSGGALNTDHHMEIDFSFQANREIDPANMIYLARDQVASHIADNTVFDLENRFLGKTESSISSGSSNRVGMVGKYNAIENTNDSGPYEHKTFQPERTAANEDVFEEQDGQSHYVRESGQEAKGQYGPGNEVYEEIDGLYLLINEALIDVRDLQILPQGRVPHNLNDLQKVYDMLIEAYDNTQGLQIGGDGYTIDFKKKEANKKITRAIYAISQSDRWCPVGWYRTIETEMAA